MSTKVKLVKCPYCGTTFDSTEGVCPECEYDPDSAEIDYEINEEDEDYE